MTSTPLKPSHVAEGWVTAEPPPGIDANSVNLNKNTDKIDPDFKAKWIDALRSGRYKQTREVLRGPVWDDEAQEFVKDQTGYCCLGVACNLTYRGWRPSDDPNNNIEGAFDWRKGLQATDTKGFPFVNNKVAESLAVLNDSGATFEQIADWIEEYL